MKGVAWFWAVVLCLVAGTGATLQVLGPMPHPVAPVAVAASQDPAWTGRIASPDPALLEPGRLRAGGLLPRIASDGRTPRVSYARPALPADGRPRVALVLAGFGQMEADSRGAIGLPAPVTLAVSAYARDPGPLMQAAREAGHEMLASLPMESEQAGYDDAGQYALLTGAPPVVNQDRLEAVMGRIQGYAGMTGASDGMLGERFAAQASSFQAVLSELTRRGLFYLDPRVQAPGLDPLPVGTFMQAADVVLDPGDAPGRADIEAGLAALERMARQRGSAIGVALRLRRVTLEGVGDWTRGAEARGIVLVPVSALVLQVAVQP